MRDLFRDLFAVALPAVTLLGWWLERKSFVTREAVAYMKGFRDGRTSPWAFPPSKGRS